MLLLFNIVVWGQASIEFAYDNAGNRIIRQVVTLKSGTISDPNEVVEISMGEKSIKLYPNPTDGMLIMNISNFVTSDKVTIQVSDMNGRVLIKEEQTNANFNIDLTQYPKGFYILSAIIDRECNEWKIIKE
jgi:hypothetical protein